MKICLILEGSYPYAYGGVSSWMHNYIKAMPEHEFILWVIGARASDRGKFKYELPENVTGVTEVFLDDALKVRANKNDKFKLDDDEKQALYDAIDCERPDWNVLFSMYQDKKYNPASFLMSESFLDVLTDLCKTKYPYVAFAETFHTIRSMLLPVLYLIGSEVPVADCYHTICTGYGGLLAALGQFKTGRPIILSEHGIYSREREEEIIRANWVIPAFKRQWIKFFYMLSDVAYKRATFITSLFGNASKIQQELGAEANKCKVIPNGIHYEKFCDIPLKEDDGFVDIGAVIRLAPIKDVKTLIYAFNELKAMRSNIRLHILGGTDDEDYARECHELVDSLHLKNVIFAGQVNVIEYMKKLDFTMLTSISEGQPLSVLESFAARRPVVTTDVGCCRQLIEGEEGDFFGIAGFCVPPMHREGLAQAMEKLCESKERREEMGEIGRTRVEKFFRHKMMIERFASLYQGLN
ncbi:GT4 family glycosyltransferase PelF [Butyrivibrio sp. YAB3001]|uniref:GT4 family glycosyltransferase PelF n=1 Tax=Butyrivibrio sp. YAB3001 TaxID=1520812 RepID=UPI0008F66520|nr:GT4 family glycosyltransferase PelF [Butyrivibrio sp. YAB3001]SFC09957.1 Glycosyltransferase involved in cell wall bisynthesis [Butyrivibrio sp. YAB3001]